MNVLILGGDGYIGRALGFHMMSHGHTIALADNLARRWWVREIGSDSLLPIPDKDETQGLLTFCDIARSQPLGQIIEATEPAVIVDLAEMPSAPYSMKDRAATYATLQNNCGGTINLLWAMRELCPNVPLIKLGTMGEYGDTIYNGQPIPEAAFIPVDINGVETFIPVPRKAGSFYHWTKVFDSHMIQFACELWGLRCTDINQGIVYGTRTQTMRTHNLYTRFDYDSYFGTVVNRFVTQAVAGHPLTVYGEGGQTRGYINLNDSVEAIRLIAENPPTKGEFRVVNQLTEVLSVLDIAEKLKAHYPCAIEHVPNPRVEKEQHEYQPKALFLKNLGLTNPTPMSDELELMLKDIMPFADNINRDVIRPQASWR